MGMLIFLLSFPAAIVVWFFTAKKMRAKGSTPAARHVAGGALGFVTWFVLVIVGVAIDPPADTQKQPIAAAEQTPPPEAQPTASTPTFAPAVAASQQTESENKQAEPQPTPVAVRTLDMDFNTFRKRSNTDFKDAGLPFNIPANIKPEMSKSEGAVRATAIITLSDGLHAVVATDPTTGKVTSIMANITPSRDRLENIQRSGGAAIMLASADGDNGNKTVGGKILQMQGKALDVINKSTDSNKDAQEKFVHNGVKYGITISKHLPVFMLYAEPVDK